MAIGILPRHPQKEQPLAIPLSSLILPLSLNPFSMSDSRAGDLCKGKKGDAMTHPLIEEVEKDLSKKSIDAFEVGDTVKVHVRIIEGEKERIQIFQGVVIARRGRGINESITVRRVVHGEGVERIFPLHTPSVVKIEPVRRGRVHRAKLYYLRKRVGKATRLPEETRKRRALVTTAKPEPEEEEAEETDQEKTESS